MKAFEVSADVSRHLLSITMRGFWDAATFDAFAIDFERALQTLHRAGGCTYAIVDGREFAVQSREILGRFENIMRANGPYLAKRTASIVPGELNRMQAKRVTESLTRRDFTTMEDAEAWLFSDQAANGRAA
ncbi:MAG TPA: hypothetical protein VGE65_02590 [Sphingobium sp.]